MAAYLIGRDDDYLGTLERAHNACERRPMRSPSVARSGSAFACSCAARWAARPAGFARAQRLLDGDARECAERGYLLLPVVEQRLERVTSRLRTPAQLTPPPSASAVATRTWLPAPATSRAGFACSRGRSRLVLRSWTRPWSWSPLGSCPPLVTGLMYCSVIAACQAGVRDRPRPRVDRRPFAVVRGPTRYGRLRRRLPGASGGDHAASGRVAGGDR